MNQVITIRPDGGVSGLERKRGQGVDIKVLGHAHVERSSHVVWDETDQCWEVEFLAHSIAGRILTMRLWCKVIGDPTYPLPEGSKSMGFDEPLVFQDYDDAVRAEVAFLDALRVQGKLDQG